MILIKVKKLIKKIISWAFNGSFYWHYDIRKGWKKNFGGKLNGKEKTK